MLEFYQNTYQNMSTIRDDWINVDVKTLPTGTIPNIGDQVAAIQASALKAADKTTAVNSLINSQNAMLKFYQNTYQNMSTIKDDWINVDVNTLPSGSISNVK